MEEIRKPISSRELEWHSPEEIPSADLREHMLVAYTYKENGRYPTLVDKLYFNDGDLYLKESDNTVPIAWASFDISVPKQMLEKYVSDRLTIKKDQEAVIKAKRIKELEAELAKLKSE